MSKKGVQIKSKCFVYSGRALSYKASSQAPRFLQSERNMIKTPTGRRQPDGYLQSVVELNPGQLERNQNQRLERDLSRVQPNANPMP